MLPADKSAKSPLIQGQHDNSTEARRLSTRDALRQRVSDARISVSYIFYCVLCAIASLVMITFLIISHSSGVPVQLWLIILDGTLTTVIALETGLDILIEGKRFCKSSWHLFDLFASAVSVVCFILLILERLQIMLSLQDAVGVAVLMVRYSAQSFRVIRYIRASVRSRDQLSAVDTDAGKIMFPEEDPLLISLGTSGRMEDT